MKSKDFEWLTDEFYALLPHFLAEWKRMMVYWGFENKNFSQITA